MIVKFKQLKENAALPTYAHNGDACLDLYASEITTNFGYIEVDFGIAIEIPTGHVGLMFPRSSISNTAFSLANSCGIIDENFRGPLKARFRCHFFGTVKDFKPGDRICQLMVIPIPKLEPIFVNELTNSNRDSNGFGSSGV